jgi:hypothetical protein
VALWSCGPAYRAEMYCDSCEVRNEFKYVLKKKVDRLYGLVVRVPCSVPGAIILSEKYWVWNGIHSAS